MEMASYFSIPVKLGGARTAGLFPSPGNLVEPDAGDEDAGRATNYVWAINVTTDPWSLWLIYDYLSEEDLGFDCVISLHEIYNNVPNAREHRWHTYKKLDTSFLGLKDEWDMLKALDNFRDSTR